MVVEFLDDQLNPTSLLDQTLLSAWRSVGSLLSQLAGQQSADNNQDMLQSQ